MLLAPQCWPGRDQMSRIIAITIVVAGLISTSLQTSRSMQGALQGHDMLASSAVILLWPP